LVLIVPRGRKSGMRQAYAYTYVEPFQDNPNASTKSFGTAADAREEQVR
jgi:hypothetical protein